MNIKCFIKTLAIFAFTLSSMQASKVTCIQATPPDMFDEDVSLKQAIFVARENECFVTCHYSFKNEEPVVSRIKTLHPIKKMLYAPQIEVLGMQDTHSNIYIIQNPFCAHAEGRKLYTTLFKYDDEEDKFSHFTFAGSDNSLVLYSQEKKLITIKKYDDHPEYQGGENIHKNLYGSKILKTIMTCKTFLDVSHKEAETIQHNPLVYDIVSPEPKLMIAAVCVNGNKLPTVIKKMDFRGHYRESMQLIKPITHLELWMVPPIYNTYARHNPCNAYISKREPTNILHVSNADAEECNEMFCTTDDTTSHFIWYQITQSKRMYQNQSDNKITCTPTNLNPTAFALTYYLYKNSFYKFDKWLSSGTTLFLGTADGRIFYFNQNSESYKEIDCTASNTNTLEFDDFLKTDDIKTN